MKNYVLWATGKNQPKWAEDIITDTNDLQKLEKAKQWVIEHNFINIRVMTYDDQKLDKPDFIGTINK